MSIYNGFISRQQEHKYYEIVKHLVMALQKRLFKFYAGEDCDETKFQTILNKIRNKLINIEASKYAEPKFSDLVSNFIDKLQTRSYQTSRFSSASNLSTISHTFDHKSLSGSKLKQQYSRMNTDSKSLEIQNFLLQKSQKRSLSSDSKNNLLKYKKDPINSSLIQSRLQQKIEEFRLIRGSFRKPKLSEYIIHETKKQQMLEKIGQKVQKNNYIGERRKKFKKAIKSFAF